MYFGRIYEAKIECLNAGKARQETQILAMFLHVIDRNLVLFAQFGGLSVAEKEFQSVGWPITHLSPNKIGAERRLCEKSIHVKGFTESKYVEALFKPIRPCLLSSITHFWFHGRGVRRVLGWRGDGMRSIRLQGPQPQTIQPGSAILGGSPAHALSRTAEFPACVECSASGANSVDYSMTSTRRRR
jgi:hypothetical protein